MKKTTLIFAAFCLLAGSANAQDKAFKKGDMTVELGAGLGLYRTHAFESYNQTNYFTNQKERITKDTTDAAASAIYPIAFEYGVTNWLGIGARVAYCKYLGGKDSVTGDKPTVHSVDADIFADFHLVKSKHFDMPIRVTLGYSNFKYLSNDGFGSQAKDNGINYGIALVPRIYFGDHIGMYFNVGYAGYNYPSFIFSNDTDSNVNDNDGRDWKYKLSGNGFNLGIGLIGKF
ncbi:MAG: hypothetical protein JWP12_2606 [Bacteroidetes bacterium]|nr:hypothetical protein [Bacteroidota bacterium]